MSNSRILLRHVFTILAFTLSSHIALAQANPVTNAYAPGTNIPFAGSAWVQSQIGKFSPPPIMTEHKPDMVYTFKVKEPITVSTARGKSRTLILQPGDVVDMAAPEDLLQDDPLRRTLTDEVYVPKMLSEKYANGRMRMSIRYARNSSENGTEIYVPGDRIRKLSYRSLDEGTSGSDKDDEGEVIDDSTATEGTFCLECEVKRLQVNPMTNVGQWSAQQVAGISIMSQFNRYSNSSEVNKLISYAKHNYYTVTQTGRKVPIYIGKNSKGKKVTYCYRAIKKYLAESGLVPSNFISNGQGLAKTAVQDLKPHGFKNLLDDPKLKTLLSNPDMAPKGAVMVYAPNDGTAAGHVEIKTENSGTGGYVSIDESRNAAFGMTTPRNGKPRRVLIGVMVKS